MRVIVCMSRVFLRFSVFVLIKRKECVSSLSLLIIISNERRRWDTNEGVTPDHTAMDGNAKTMFRYVGGGDQV